MCVCVCVCVMWKGWVGGGPERSCFNPLLLTHPFSVKNMVGLATLFAECPRLQSHAVLIIVAGSVVVEDAPDDDGAACARALHALFDSGRLPAGTARWIRAQANPVRNGELYRMVADTRGAFAMPSLYEVSGV